MHGGSLAAVFETMAAMTRTSPTAPRAVERAAMTMPWVRRGKREVRLQKRLQQESSEDI